MIYNRKDEFSLFSVSMLNHTEIEEKLKQNEADFVQGTAPRWIFVGRARNLADPLQNTSLAILFANTSKELEIGLGRDFPQRALQKNQAIISKSVLRSIGIADNSHPELEIYIDLFSLINAFIGGSINSFSLAQFSGGSRKPKYTPKNSEINFEQFKKIQLKPIIKEFMKKVIQTINDQKLKIKNPLSYKKLEAYLDQLLPDEFNLNLINLYNKYADFGEENPLILKHKFKIVDSVDTPAGKWSGGLGKAVIIDDSYLMTFILEALSENIRILIKNENPIIKIIVEILLQHLDALKQLKIEQYALTTQMVFKDRTQIYLKSTDERDKLMRNNIRFLASNVFGLSYKAKYDLPLLSAVDGMGSFLIILDVSFMIVTFFLSLLSVLLIYSLMMSVFL